MTTLEMFQQENAELKRVAVAFLESISNVEGLPTEAKTLEVELWRLVDPSPVILVNCVAHENGSGFNISTVSKEK